MSTWLSDCLSHTSPLLRSSTLFLYTPRTMSSPRPSTSAGPSGKRALPGGKAPLSKRVSVEVEKVEETAVYTISANHGLTARVSYWNGRALLQLRCVKQDAQGDSRRILPARRDYYIGACRPRTAGGIVT